MFILEQLDFLTRIAKQGDLVVLDIDHTLLIPVAKKKYKDAPKAIQNASVVINTLQERNIPVICLTARHGDIKKKRQKTHEHLEMMGIKASQLETSDDQPFNFSQPEHRIEQGIIFARTLNQQVQKGHVLAQFIQQLKHQPHRILVVDDNLEQLESIDTVSQQNDLSLPPIKLFHFQPDYCLLRGFPENNETLPRNLNALKPVKELRSSSGRVVVLEDEQSKRYILKQTHSAEQLRDEIFNDGLYRAMGIFVPDFAVFEHIPASLSQAAGFQSSGLYRLSEYIEPNAQWLEDPHALIETDQDDVLSQLAKGFVMDALLGNVDIAAKRGNLILEKGSHRLYRIDNGCGLRFRARGDHKTSGTVVKEIDSLLSEQSNFGTLFYKKVTSAVIREEVTRLLDNRESLYQSMYALNSTLKIKAGDALIELLFHRLYYLRHRFCPEYPLATPHHPADPDYTAAGTLNLYQDKESGEFHVLLGQRIRHEWWGNLGGKSDAQDADLAYTAARETREESMDLIQPCTDTLRECPYFDLLTRNSKGQPSLYRMYILEEKQGIEPRKFLKRLQASDNPYAKEYTDYCWIPLKSLLQALDAPEGEMEQQAVLEVITEANKKIALHPPLGKMLKQKGTQAYLQQLVDGNVCKQVISKGIQLGTPSEIRAALAKQAEKKAHLLLEVKEKASLELASDTPAIQPEQRCQTDMYLSTVLGKDYQPENNKANLSSFFDEDKRYSEYDLSQEQLDKVHDILEAERLQPDKIVLYHSTSSEVAFFINLMSSIRQTLFLKSADYKSFRAFDLFGAQYKHIDELIAFFSKEGTKDIDNYESFYHEMILSCNAFLLGNDGKDTSSSLNLFFTNSTRRPPDFSLLIKQSLETLHIDTLLIDKILDLYQRFCKRPQSEMGHLYQMFIDQDRIDEVAYVSKSLGVLNPLSISSDEKSYRPSEVLNAWRQDTDLISPYDLSRLQIRLFLQPDLLHSKHFKMIEYYDHDFAPLQDINTELAALSQQVVRQLYFQGGEREEYKARQPLLYQLEQVQKHCGLIPQQTQNQLKCIETAILTRQKTKVFTLIRANPDLNISRLNHPTYQDRFLPIFVFIFKYAAEDFNDYFQFLKSTPGLKPWIQTKDDLKETFKIIDKYDVDSFSFWLHCQERIPDLISCAKEFYDIKNCILSADQFYEEHAEQLHSFVHSCQDFRYISSSLSFKKAEQLLAACEDILFATIKEPKELVLIALQLNRNQLERLQPRFAELFANQAMHFSFFLTQLSEADQYWVLQECRLSLPEIANNLHGIIHIDKALTIKKDQLDFFYCAIQDLFVESFVPIGDHSYMLYMELLGQKEMELHYRLLSAISGKITANINDVVNLNHYILKNGYFAKEERIYLLENFPTEKLVNMISDYQILYDITHGCEKNIQKALLDKLFDHLASILTKEKISPHIVPVWGLINQHLSNTQLNRLFLELMKINPAILAEIQKRLDSYASLLSFHSDCYENHMKISHYLENLGSSVEDFIQIMQADMDSNAKKTFFFKYLMAITTNNPTVNRLNNFMAVIRSNMDASYKERFFQYNLDSMTGHLIDNIQTIGETLSEKQKERLFKRCESLFPDTMICYKDHQYILRNVEQHLQNVKNIDDLNQFFSELHFKEKNQYQLLAAYEEKNPQQFIFRQKNQWIQRPLKREENNFLLALEQFKGHLTTFSEKDALVRVPAEALAETLGKNFRRYRYNEISFKTFQEQSQLAINQAKPRLNQHRGMKQMLGNLALAVLGMGVGYLIAGLIHKQSTGRFLFFKTERLDKAEAIEKTLVSLKEVSQSTQQ